MDLQPLIDRLAEFPPGEHPFVSVYLDARPDQVGRDKSHAFLRHELKARAETYPEHSPARASIDARVTFIEEPALLADAGGVGGLLRFRVRRAA